jgi:hypothetical protein
MLPNCSIYTGRPSCNFVSHFLGWWPGRLYFIGLVVVLRVVLKDLGLLMVVEIPSEVIQVDFFAPLLAVDEPNHM